MKKILLAVAALSLSAMAAPEVHQFGEKTSTLLERLESVRPRYEEFLSYAGSNFAALSFSQNKKTGQKYWVVRGMTPIPSGGCAYDNETARLTITETPDNTPVACGSRPLHFDTKVTRGPGQGQSPGADVQYFAYETTELLMAVEQCRPVYVDFRNHGYAVRADFSAKDGETQTFELTAFSLGHPLTGPGQDVGRMTILTRDGKVIPGGCRVDWF